MRVQVGRIVFLLKRAERFWSSDNASNTGAALAFYCAFSIAPLLVILLGAVHSAQRTQGVIANAISVVTLLIGATTVLAALRSALQIMWQSERLASTGIRGWVRTRRLSLGFFLTLGFFLLISLTLSTALSNLRGRCLETHRPQLGEEAAPKIGGNALR
ncbi:MAG TPA: hypothetical protein VGL55_05505 [Steroidobacteraceae bacterium]|jgi:membrane protein